ncbi:MAG: hypothetical protein AAFV98_15800 [Chloroflexota bacterium]
MSYYEKPKGMPPKDDDLQAAKRQFYWQLFLHLMVPATILATIFGLPVLLIEHYPDQLNARCTIYDSADAQYGVRITSTTERLNTVRYYVTRDGGNNWENVYVTENDYRMARADCDTVVFNSENRVAAVRVEPAKILTFDFDALRGATITDVSESCNDVDTIFPVYNEQLINFDFTCRAG